MIHSMNTTDRILQLERANRGLVRHIAALSARHRELEPGHYLVSDDGDYDGPYPDIARAAQNRMGDEEPFTVVTIGDRHEPAQAASEQSLCDEAAAGIDYPWTLYPPRIAS